MVGSILSMLWNVWLQILLKFVLSNMLEPQKLPKEHGLQPGTYEYSSFVDKYVDPRGIPPSVVEDAIINGTKSPGNKPGTFVYETIDIRVVFNENGDIITVIPK